MPLHFTIRNRVPYNKPLTNLACSGRTGEYWPSVVTVRTSLRSVRTATTSGQYSPVRPSRSVSKRLILRYGCWWKKKKKTWEGVNNIIGRKSTNAKPINLIKTPNVGNTVISDPISISNIFNRHFASVGPKLAKKLPPVQRPYFVFLSQTKSHDSSFVYNPVTPEKVKLEIACISNNKSHGLHSCPPQLLKCLTNVISYKLSFGQNHKFLYSEWSMSFQTKNG